MLRTLRYACLLWVLSAPSGAVWAGPAEDAAVVQKTLPGLVGRAAKAEAQAADAAAFFRGDLSLMRAFPELALSPLYQPGFVADARRSLLAASKTRAVERLQAPPPNISPAVTARWTALWERVHRAEDARDAGQGRLLAAVAAGLGRAPGLTRGETQSLEARWAAALAKGAEPTASANEIARASMASTSIQGLMRLRQASLRHMAIPGDTALIKLIETELGVPVPGAGSRAEVAQARARLDRIRRAAPLLSNVDEVLARADALAAAMGPVLEEIRKNRAGARVAQAQAQAAEAKERADAAADAQASVAQLEAMVADLRARIASELQTEGVRHADVLTRISAHQASLDAHRADLGAALSPLADDRTGKIHKVLRDARRTVTEIRAERASQVEVRREARARWAAAESELDAGVVSAADPATAGLAGAIADYRATHEVVRRHLDSEQAEVQALLHEAKAVRDEAYARASTTVRREVPVQDEIRREAREIPDLMLTAGRSYMDAVRAFPSKVIEMRTLGEVLVRIGELILLLGIWIVVRRRCGAWIELGLSSLNPQTKSARRPWEEARLPAWMIAGDVAALRDPLVSVARPLADLLLASILFCFLESRVPVLGLVALLWAFAALAQTLPGLVNLTLITPADVRPALRLTSLGVRDRSRWTVRMLTLWCGLDAGLVFLGQQVLDAPRMAEVAHDFAGALLVILFLVALRRWTPEIRTKIRNDGDPSALNNYISAGGASGIGLMFRAGLGLAVLTVGMVVSLLTLIVEGRAGLGWLSAALARRQLKVDDDADHASLSHAQQEAIRARAMAALQAPAPVEEIAKIFVQWEGEHRQGMVAVIGDRGMGKSRTLDALGERLAADHSVVTIQMPGRITDPDAALLWLTEAAGVADFSLPDTGDLEARAEAVGHAIGALPETLFIVDDTHRLFLRSVGCFDALRAILVAMQTCSGRHFWLCGFHGPGFSFLDGVRAVSHLAVFRARVELAAVPAASLRSWLEDATAASGLTPHYQGLLHRPAEGSHLDRMLSRAASAYWRLLAEASQGNPDVALEYWLNGLHAPESADTGAVGVGLFEAPDTEDLEALGDGALFALTALIIHDGATLDELHATLNLPAGEVRGTCRSLEAMGIIGDENLDETYEVTKRWLPAVERLLRRKSFLHRR